jgi:hypothetical protein
MAVCDPPICAIHIGAAETAVKAQEIAELFQGCPYTVSYVSHGIQVVGVLVLPASKKWWADLQDQPGLLGLENLQVFFSSRVDVHSPWSQGAVKPELEHPPCGSNCGKCQHYGGKCQGCPASLFYRKPSGLGDDNII